MSVFEVNGELSGFDGKRVLIVGTGALAVSWLPSLVLQFTQKYPRAQAKVALTKQALQFVTPTAVNMVTERAFFLDAWHEGPYAEAPHVVMSQWADAVVVYPATLNFLGRLANGIADTPLLLALQCMRVPIGLAPSLPPGAFEGPGYARHAAALAEIPNVALVPPVRGPSMSTGEFYTGPPASFSSVLEAVHEKLLRSAGNTAGDEAVAS